MAISTALCTSFKQEILDGIHQADDTYKIALYTSSASLGSGTTAYSATNEVSGTGYTAGGAALSGRASSVSGTTAYLDWDDVSWSNSTITARGALIYNASRSNKAVAVFDFGSDVVSTNGTFTLAFPTAGASTAIVRLG